MNQFKFIFLLIILTLTVEAQVKVDLKNVEVPDSVQSYLCSYIGPGMENALIIIKNLDNFKNKKFVDGIYAYWLIASQRQPKIFIKENKSVKVFSGEDIDSILSEFIVFRKELSLPDEKVLKYLIAISKFLKNNPLPSKSDSIKIIY